MEAPSTDRRATGPCAIRRGSTYFIVLMAVTLVVSITLSGVLLARVELRTARATADWQGATMLAYAAVDHATAALNNVSSWRTTFSNEDPIPEIDLGDGTISWMLEDERDGKLHEGDTDPVRIYGIGRLGSSARAVSVLAFPTGAALNVLRAAVHADGDLRFRDGGLLKRGPASSNQELRVDGDTMLAGDVEAASLDNQGTISGTVTVPAPSKPMPADTVYDLYLSMSTKIDYPLGGLLENGIVAPNINSFDNELSPSGVYRVDVNGSSTNPRSLTIRNCRIVGTLVVRLKDRSTIDIAEGVVWEPASAWHPALVVLAESDMGTTVTIGGRGVLSESATGVNFNPPDLPFTGEAGDGDMLDEYDSVLRGVFHVTRDAVLPASRTVIDGSDRIVGCVIVEGDLEAENAPRLEADLRLLSSPPLGYSTGDQISPIAATWRWESVP